MPIYLQIVRHIKRGIVSGAVGHGDEVPSRRVLSALLGVNPNTIQKAYAELERQGITYSVPGRGSFVSPELDVVTEEHKNRIVREARALLEEARATGMRAEDFLPLIGQVWEKGGKP